MGEGSVWVEINDQAARDKVSHALRFAARNLKKKNSQESTATSSTTTTASSKRRSSDSMRKMNNNVKSSKNRKTLGTVADDLSSVEPSSSSGSESSDLDDEPIPLSQVFDHKIEMSPKILQNSNLLQGGSTAAQQEDDDGADFDVAFSMRSLQLDDECEAALRKEVTQQQKQQQQQTTTKPQKEDKEEDKQSPTAASTLDQQREFNTLRSEDLNEILDEPLDGEDEW